jgi:sterol desaturase/sphingolipid hydroxylase (fatty acid hydroxylase superfamily)
MLHWQSEAFTTSMPPSIDYKLLIAAGVLACLWAIESFVVLADAPGERAGRVRHGVKNLGFGLGNAVLAGLLFGGALAFTVAWAEARGFGLLRLLPVSGWPVTILGLLVLDLWMYLWHRANHAVPFLWRFHRMHHADARMDVTSGVRFHTGEVCMSAMIRLPVLLAAGIGLWNLVLYEAIFLPVVLFHHARLRLPRRLEGVLQWMVVTPGMHRVHHSRWQPETDSNFGSILPWWDRLFGSFRRHLRPEEIRVGLDELDAPRWHSARGMLLVPLAPLGARGAASRPAEPSGAEPAASAARREAGGKLA